MSLAFSSLLFQLCFPTSLASLLKPLMSVYYVFLNVLNFFQATLFLRRRKLTKTEIDKRVFSMQDESDLVDMASVVGALRRITWAAAVGQLSVMGSSSPVTSVLKRPSGKSAKVFLLTMHYSSLLSVFGQPCILLQMCQFNCRNDLFLMMMKLGWIQKISICVLKPWISWWVVLFLALLN